MDLKAWVESVSKYSPTNPNTPASINDTTIAETTNTTIRTPSASNWTDVTIHDGAGSDEGDTFKYECKECRFVCASVEELCEHLVVSGEKHVVCPVCLREFTTSGESFGEMMQIRTVHFEKEHLNANENANANAMGDITPNIRNRAQILGREGRMGVYDYRAVSDDAAKLAREVGLDHTTATMDGSWNANNSTPAAPPVSVAMPTGKDKSRSENTPLNPKVNGVLDERRLGQGPYYWEPDWMLIQKFGGVDMDALREERDGEMQWLRGFEGV